MPELWFSASLAARFEYVLGPRPLHNERVHYGPREQRGGLSDVCIMLDFIVARIPLTRKLDLLAEYLAVDVFMADIILAGLMG